MRRSAAVLLAVASLAGCDQSATQAPARASQPVVTPTPAPVPAPTPPVQAAAPAGNFVTPDGFGVVRVGMPADEALRALGPGWRLGEPLEPGETMGCRHIVEGSQETRGPISYMVEEMRVTRVEVDAGSIGDVPVRTEAGIAVGATEADVRRAYGAGLFVLPHTYADAPARYLDVWSRGAPASAEQYVQDSSARGLRFETDERQIVRTIHAGGPSIQYVEGCA